MNGSTKSASISVDEIGRKNRPRVQNQTRLKDYEFEERWYI